MGEYSESSEVFPILLYERPRRQPKFASSRKIIEDDDFVSFVENESGKIAPDKTCAAGNQIFHEYAEVVSNADIAPFSYKPDKESSMTVNHISHYSITKH
jgi:hypothetical protein